MSVVECSTAELRQMDDLSLLDAALARDEAAWRELVRRFRKLIYHCISLAAGRRQGALPVDEVDEVFGEVCLNLLRNDMRKLRLYDPGRGTKLSSWIGLIAIRTCYDHLRAASRRIDVEGTEFTPEQADQHPGPLDRLLQRERFQRLALLVSGLAPRERRFFELYYDRGMEPHDVAREMNISVGTVYAKKHKLRSRLLAHRATVFAA